MKEVLKDMLMNLPENSVICLVVKSDNYEATNQTIINKLLETKKFGCLINVNKPYRYLLDSFNSKKMDISNLFFIDCITKIAGGKTEDVDNCVFIDSPQDLISLSIVIHEVINHVHDQKQFILIDSLSTLSLHNNTDRVLKFIHYLTGKMRLWSISGIFICLHEETDKKLIAELAQFCDSIIHV